MFSAEHGALPKSEIDGALAEIAKQPHVASVDDLRLSEDGHTAYATVGYDQTAEKLDASARERLEKATDDLPGADVAMSGEPIDGAATGGFPVGEVIGLVIAIVLLIVVLRNLRAARNALLAAFAGLGFGFGALMWLAAATDVPGLAPTLAGMLGLGAGIDYALLLAARQQEELRAGHDPIEAAKRANASAGHSALTAAGIVLVSISGLLVTGIPFVGRAGVAAGLVVLACAVTCVVLLPARFARAGRRMLPRRERPRGSACAPRGPRAGRASRSSPPAPSPSRWPPRPRVSSSASPTTATSRPTPPSARPTTGSPRASARASTARWWWPCRSRSRARARSCSA